MIGIILTIVVVILIVVLLVKTKIAKNKEPRNRSALEKILVSMFVSAKKDLEEAADQIRTPEVSKEECLQKIKESIASLMSDYEKQMADLIYHQKRLKEEIIPKLKNKPGQYEGKARIWKKKMEEAQKSGDTALEKAAKETAINFLSLKKGALERIDRAEKQYRESETVKAVAEATYESRKATLEDIQMEVETSMSSNISAAKFSQSLNMIKALKEETADKLRKQNASIEASNLVSGSDSTSESIVDPGMFEGELEKL